MFFKRKSDFTCELLANDLYSDRKGTIPQQSAFMFLPFSLKLFFSLYMKYTALSFSFCISSHPPSLDCSLPLLLSSQSLSNITMSSLCSSYETKLCRFNKNKIHVQLCILCKRCWGSYFAICPAAHDIKQLNHSQLPF